MMSQSKYSLTWEAHVRNVCDGLSSLQQNGEFVDMTLAADGHMVKVHQVVLALASPYFKELITSAQCPHPIIFLSKVTHATLSAILEYIYTGEVLVSLEHLNDLIDAAKELHIKGLKDMRMHSSLAKTSKHLPEEQVDGEMLVEEDLCMFDGSQVEDEDIGNQKHQQVDVTDNTIQNEYDHDQLKNYTTEDIEDEQLMHNTQNMKGKSGLHSEVDLDQEEDTIEQEILDENMQDSDDNISFEGGKLDPTSALQYTVSNQGSLQMILNRFVYYLKHTNKDRSRQWRCVDYLNYATKCPAVVFTKDDMVIQRIAAHTHPFHDKKILKKLRNRAVFSAFTEAEKEGHIKKKKSIDDLSNTD